jgi:uncharacterized integral membrane protein
VSGERPDLEGLSAAPESTPTDVHPRRTAVERGQRARLAAAGLVGAVIAAFALLNVNDVKVHWLFATGRTPLIVVIAFAFVLGLIVDRLAVRSRRKRRE